MCALAVCKALPDWQHEIVTFGRPDGTIALPPGVRLLTDPGAAGRDAHVLLLHNTPPERTAGPPTPPTLQFHHSHARLADADLHLYASDWLRGAATDGWTCYQSVDTSATSGERSAMFTVGRLTGAAPAKWGPTIDRLFAGIADLGLPIDREVCGGRLGNGVATELPMRPDAAHAYLPRWHVLVYHSGVTESFGRVVVEAMAAGCVPLVDPRGGPAETVVNGVTGTHCRTPDDFIDRVRRLYHDRALWGRLSLAARARAHAVFRHGAFRQRLLQAFGWAHHRALGRLGRMLQALARAQRACGHPDARSVD